MPSRMQVYYAENRERVLQQVKEYRDEKQAWLWNTKEERGCEECGESDPRVLEFAHIDRATKIATLKGTKRNKSFAKLGWDAMKAEVAKCIVLCANCHRRQTFIENGWTEYGKGDTCTPSSTEASA